MRKLTPAEIILMKKACEVTRDALVFAETLVRPGISTSELDKAVENYIIEKGATPAFKFYGDFPATICASVNDTVIHGIPSDKIILKEGDIISVDVGAKYKGFYGDAARTFPVGKISAEKQKLIDVTKESFFVGIQKLKVGARLGELSHAIQEHVEKNGYSVVREFVGHGINEKLHDDPQIPNFGTPNKGPLIEENVCLAVEPMVNMGRREIFVSEDGWTVTTRDGLPSAHYENTVLVKKNGVEILT